MGRNLVMQTEKVFQVEDGYRGEKREHNTFKEIAGCLAFASEGYGCG